VEDVSLLDRLTTSRSGAWLEPDRLDIERTDYQPRPDLTAAASFRTSSAFSVGNAGSATRSRAIVNTGQPDWGSVHPLCRTAKRFRAIAALPALLGNHNEFHEQCVERIFMDICAASRSLPPSMRAMRRWRGLDINPPVPFTVASCR
jgi:7-cyano-7-deazaguanine reductase